MSKTKKTIIILAIFGALFGATSFIGYQKEQRMDNYAKEHSCSWHYDFYVNEEPVCK